MNKINGASNVNLLVLNVEKKLTSVLFATLTQGILMLKGPLVNVTKNAPLIQFLTQKKQCVRTICFRAKLITVI